MKILALLFSLSFLFGSGAFAANTPPNFNTAKWQQLVQTILHKGAATSVRDGVVLSLSHVVPNDPMLPRQADYISLWGAVVTGKFYAQHATAVSEHWQIDEKGNWDIDQWLFQVSLDGELVGVQHVHLVETPDAEVLTDDLLPTAGPSDAGVLGHWGQLLDSWYGWSNARLEPSIMFTPSL